MGGVAPNVAGAAAPALGPPPVPPPGPPAVDPPTPPLPPIAAGLAMPPTPEALAIPEAPVMAGTPPAPLAPAKSRCMPAVSNPCGLHRHPAQCWQRKSQRRRLAPRTRHADSSTRRPQGRLTARKEALVQLRVSSSLSGPRSIRMNEPGAGPCHEQWRQTRFSITRSVIATARSSLTRGALW
jgi:hypothetical protein